MSGLKVGGTEVIAANGYIINIASLDARSQETFIDAIRFFDHKLVMVDSSGTTKQTLYGANNDIV